MFAGSLLVIVVFRFLKWEKDKRIHVESDISTPLRLRLAGISSKADYYMICTVAHWYSVVLINCHKGSLRISRIPACRRPSTGRLFSSITTGGTSY
jgi:hypothetical protein